MGALHLGHIKLIQKAKKRNAVRIVSIFINPSQFGPSEDFKNYPRTIHNDLNLLRNEDVDIVFLPIENEILKYNPNPRANRSIDGDRKSCRKADESD